MSEQLAFGTAGMRAPIGPASHQMNVFQVTRITAGAAMWLGKHRSISPERRRLPEAYSMAEQTTLTLSVIAQAQKAGKVCAFIDAEHALDPIYAAKLGVDVKEL